MTLGDFDIFFQEIKNNAEWWAAEQIDDSTFVSGIQYLVKVGIIKVS